MSSMTTGFGVYLPTQRKTVLVRDIADTTASLILAKSPNRDFGEMQDNLWWFFLIWCALEKRLDIIFARILQSIFNNDLICYFFSPFSCKLTLSYLISLTWVLYKLTLSNLYNTQVNKIRYDNVNLYNTQVNKIRYDNVNLYNTQVNKIRYDNVNYII
jgi:hypothetical protein